MTDGMTVQAEGSDPAEEHQAPAAAAPPPLRRNRDFLLLWSGQAAAALGTSIAAIVYPLPDCAAAGCGQ
jgi:hypothetical protein